MPIATPVSHLAETKYMLVLDEIHGQLARRHLTQQDLVRRGIITQSALSRRMTGATSFTLPELFDICAMLGMSVTDLLVAADRNRPRPGGAEGGSVVAGAGFEPATSGLDGPVLSLVRDDGRPITKSDLVLVA